MTAAKTAEKTAATTAAKSEATANPKELVRGNLLLLREDGSSSNTLSDSLPFMPPGWQRMASPRVTMDRRRAENDD